MFGSDPGKLEKLGDVFIRQYDAQFVGLSTALRENDLKLAQHQLHSIKGMAALIGAEKAGEIVLALEAIVEDASTAAAPLLISPQVESIVGNLEAALLPYRSWFVCRKRSDSY